MDRREAEVGWTSVQPGDVPQRAAERLAKDARVDRSAAGSPARTADGPILTP
jgi:hypothetical protein